MTRSLDFENISDLISTSIAVQSPNAILAQGDSLSIIKHIPSHSISLILTDPPYHSTKKANIVGDTAFESDEHYIDWLSQYVIEWKRILRPNGSIFCFCSSEMSARIELEFFNHFNVLSQIVWTKPNDPGFDGWKQKMKKQALRQWYAHSERIIFAEPATDGNLYRLRLGRRTIAIEIAPPWVKQIAMRLSLFTPCEPTTSYKMISQSALDFDDQVPLLLGMR